MATGVNAEQQPLYTIGHGTASIEDFIAQLRGADIASVVDVRRFPGSRRNPQYGSDELERSLNDAGIAYRHEPELGGRRKPDAASPNVALRNPSFRAYADYMTTPEFHGAFARLLDEATLRPTAILCSETVWWRCHRRLVADAAVLLADRPVVHVIGGARKPHVLTGGVRRREGELVYDEMV